MLATFLAFLGSLIPSAIKAWVAARRSTQPAPVLEGEKAGAETQAAADAQATVKTEAAVIQAQAQAPTTQNALVAEMQKGEF